MKGGVDGLMLDSAPPTAGKSSKKRGGQALQKERRASPPSINLPTPLPPSPRLPTSLALRRTSRRTGALRRTSRRAGFGLAVRPSQPKRLLWQSRQGKEIRVCQKMVAVPNGGSLRGFRPDFQANFKGFLA